VTATNRPGGSDERTTARGARSLLRRWTVLVPVLTLGVFAALCFASFVEISRREPERPLSVEEVSAEVLARYEAESRRLGEIRREARAGLDAEHFLALFAPVEAESPTTELPGGEAQDGEDEDHAKERPLPSRATVLADLQAMSVASPREVERLCRALVPLWRQKLAEAETSAAEHELLGALLRQCAVGLQRDLALAPGEREAIFHLAGELLDRQPNACASVVLLLRHAAGPGDLGSLEELQGKVARFPQLSREVGRWVASLRDDGADDRGAGRAAGI